MKRHHWHFRRLAVITGPGMVGVRAGRFWVRVVETASHRPLFSERNRIRSRTIRLPCGWRLVVQRDKKPTPFLCRRGRHRFDRRNLSGYTIEQQVAPGHVVRVPFVVCARCGEDVQTTVSVPGPRRRFPLD